MLNLHIDRRRNDSMQTQLVKGVKEYTNTHHLQGNQAMPDLHEFAQAYEITVAEAQAVYDELVKENVVEKNGDKYLLLHFEMPSIFFNKINTIIQLIEMNGYKASFKDFSIKTVNAPASLLKMMPDEEGKFVEFQRLYYGDDKPLMWCYLYYPLRKFKGFDKVDMENKQTWPYLLSTYNVKLDHIKIRYRTAIMDDELMDRLNTNNPLANLLESTILDKDEELMEYLINYTISDSFYVRFETKI